MPSPSLPTKAKKRRNQVRRVPVDGFDSPLKEAQFAFFRGYMQFFFRSAHDDIDWTKGFVSLDTELRQIAGKQPKRRCGSILSSGSPGNPGKVNSS